MPPIALKFLVIGESGSGKTSLIRRLTEGEFVYGPQATVNTEFASHDMEVGQPVHLVIWDTAGQERYYSIVRSYFRGAQGVLLVFDICDRRGFDQCPRWLRDVRMEADQNCTVLLVGNKLDRRDARAVTTGEAEGFARTHGLFYIEASALDGTNVEEAFLNVAADLLAKIQRHEMTQLDTDAVASPTESSASAASGCCA
jgi:Ras-related protein Rab-2A